MTNPLGSGIFAALALAPLAVAGGHDPASNHPNGNDKAPIIQDGAKVTAAPGKGISFESEGFKLNLKNRVQVNFGYTNVDGGTDLLGVTIRRARTALAGSAYKDTVSYMVQFEWADGAGSDILDALIGWNFWKSDDASMELVFGQAKTLFGIEATGTSSGLEFIDRARATRDFANTRSRQAMVVGKMNGGKLRWNAGLLNNDVSAGSAGSGIDDTNNRGVELNYTAGVQYGNQGDDANYYTHYKQGAIKKAEETNWVVGAAIAYGQNDAGDFTGAGVEYDSVTANVGGHVTAGTIHALVEVFIRDESVDTVGARETRAFGWQAQATHTMEKGSGNVQWAFGGRISGVHLTDVTGAGTGFLAAGLGAEGDVFEGQAVVSAYYSGHDLKTQFGYTIQQIDPDVGTDATNHVLEVQSQIVF